MKQLGNVEDVSLTGMGVIVDNALPTGTLLSISYGEGSLNGIVRHQKRLAEGCFMGIELGLVSSDSTLHVDPSKLSDDPFGSFPPIS